MIFKVGQKVTHRQTGLSGKIIKIFSANEYVVSIDHCGTHAFNGADLQKLTRKRG